MYTNAVYLSLIWLSFFSLSSHAVPSSESLAIEKRNQQKFRPGGSGGGFNNQKGGNNGGKGQGQGKAQQKFNGNGKGNAQGKGNQGKGNQGKGNQGKGNQGKGNQGKGNQGKGNQGKGNGKGNDKGNGKGNGGGKGNGQNEDPQKSFTLDPRVIAKGFAQDGQANGAANQVASLTSENNFINFCLTVPNLPLTDGKQVKEGSCDPAPIGVIPSTANMPSSKFVFPKNFDVIQADTPFTIEMAISNLETGNFVNAQLDYFSAPQTLNSQGKIRGHSHVVVESLDSLTQTFPTDPQVFAFFKGLNAKAQNGILTAVVDKGLPKGSYRLSSINSSANHQPCIVPVAQHGSLDDWVYFSVTDDGNQPSLGAPNAIGSGAGTGSSSGKGKAKGKANQAPKRKKTNRSEFGPARA